MQQVSDDVKELFEDPEFGKTLRLLAMEFGEETTLKKIYTLYQQNRPVPERMIDGQTYLAGYNGPFMIPEGFHKATLVDVKENGENCKLMFIMQPLRAMQGRADGVFLYHNIPKNELNIAQIVKIAKYIGDDFAIRVKHEIIPQTGDTHALVESVEGLNL